MDFLFQHRRGKRLVNRHSRGIVFGFEVHAGKVELHRHLFLVFRVHNVIQLLQRRYVLRIVAAITFLGSQKVGFVLLELAVEIFGEIVLAFSEQVLQLFAFLLPENEVEHRLDHFAGIDVFEDDEEKLVGCAHRGNVFGLELLEDERLEMADEDFVEELEADLVHQNQLRLLLGVVRLVLHIEGARDLTNSIHELGVFFENDVRLHDLLRIVGFDLLFHVQMAFVKLNIVVGVLGKGVSDQRHVWWQH